MRRRLLPAADALSVEYTDHREAALASHYAYWQNGLACPPGCELCQVLARQIERQSRPRKGAMPPWVSTNGDTR